MIRKFTLELENEDQIPFLDVSMQTMMVTTLFCTENEHKTNRYLIVLSNHTNFISKSVVKTLVDTVKKHIFVKRKTKPNINI